ncbi:MAG: hypothetical protein CME63_01550 [Halobacteriovoraceae bacterium]|nr:hypothetical protein [Halobacteriovoraceae bacterium]|tara:strand:+ start:33336 stop:34016 length:681 start_codon:yes stop_codon:yes gene_type:complete
MIFALIEAVKIAQTNELVRINAKDSFANGADEITKVEIRPKTGEAWVDVSEADHLLDWIYDTEEIVTASVRINDTVEKSISFEIVSEETDKLFSSDKDLYALETEIRNLIPCEYSTWNYKHREAQKAILEELNTRGLRDSEGKEITKQNIEITKELNAWSKYLTLYLIYFDKASSQESIYWEKAMRYKRASDKASNDRLFLTLDKNGAGDNEVVNLGIDSARVVRR